MSYAPNPKVYYMYTKDNDIYRLVCIAFTLDGDKRAILKNLTDGKIWDVSYGSLFDVYLDENGRQVNYFERMPEGWHPVKHSDEVDYPGYTNDPRKEYKQNGNYNNSESNDRYSDTRHGGRGYPGFIRK